MHTSLVAAAGTFALLAAPLLSQGYDFDKTTPGTLGSSLDFSFAGAPAGVNVVFLLSATGGPTPLALLDPRDPRSLSVGVEAAGLWFAQPSGAGSGTFQLPVPNDPGLHGGLLHFQTVTVPGNPLVVGPISNAVVAQLGAADTSALLPATLAVGRAFGTAIPDPVTGDVLYAGGGQGTILTATGLDSSERYDFRGMTVRPGPKLTRSRALGAAVELQDGRWLFIGGIDDGGLPLASCELYDPATRSFSTTGSMAAPRAAHDAAVLPDGRVLVIGGTTSFATPIAALAGALDSAEIWDPATGQWSAVAPMGAHRLGASVDVLIDGTVLVAGGFVVNIVFGVPVPVGSVATCEYYDVARNLWTSAPSMNHDRAIHHLNTVHLIGGGLLVSGGATAGPLLVGAQPIADCEVFDPFSKTWKVLPPMAAPRALHSATLERNGKVVVAGGAQGTLLSPVAIAGVEELDPFARSWRSLPNLRSTRGAHGAALTPDGLLVLIGGQGGPSLQSLVTVETIHL